jgi:hypothetical protein
VFLALFLDALYAEYGEGLYWRFTFLTVVIMVSFVASGVFGWSFYPFPWFLLYESMDFWLNLGKLSSWAQPSCSKRTAKSIVEELCNSFERTKEQRAAIEATVLERQIDDATLRKQ